MLAELGPTVAGSRPRNGMSSFAMDFNVYAQIFVILAHITLHIQMYTEKFNIANECLT